jgi:PAS domain-containing protein
VKPHQVCVIRVMSALAERDQEIETLRRRLGVLEAEAAGLGLAQVMTREFGGEICFWSRGMERLYGFTSAEAVGENSHKLLRTEFPPVAPCARPGAA